MSFNSNRVGHAVFKKNTVQLFFLNLMVLISGTLGLQSGASAVVCSDLFVSTSGSAGMTARTRIAADMLEPAISIYLELVKNSTPESIENFRRLQDEVAKAVKVRRPRNFSHFYLFDETEQPVSRAQKIETIIGELRRAPIRELMVQRPVEATFLAIEADRKSREMPITKQNLRIASESVIEFAIVYAQLEGLAGRTGDAGLVFSRRVPWIGFVRAQDFSVLADLARISTAMNSDPAARRAADNMVLETLRLQFAPEMMPLEIVDSLH